MKKIKSPLSIRIIFWITNISLGFLLLVFVLVLIGNVFLHAGYFRENMQLHTDLFAEVDVLETGNLHINDQDIKVELVETKPRIHFIDTPYFITKRVGFALIIVTLFACFLFWTFQRFIKNVKDGKIFYVKNIALLKRLAYGIAAFWLFTYVYSQIMYHYIAKRLEFESVTVSGEGPDYSWMLFLALFIWVLAHIFITGVKLQQENELTI